MSTHRPPHLPPEPSPGLPPGLPPEAGPRAPAGSPVPWQEDLVVVAAAVVCASFSWLCLVRLPGVDLAVETGGDTRPLGLAAIAVTAGVAAAVGVLVLRLLERTTSRALTIWTTLALGVALLSLLGTFAATTAEAQAVLLGLHGVVAAVVVVAARRSRRRRGPR